MLTSPNITVARPFKDLMCPAIMESGGSGFGSFRPFARSSNQAVFHHRDEDPKGPDIPPVLRLTHSRVEQEVPTLSAFHTVEVSPDITECCPLPSELQAAQPHSSVHLDAGIREATRPRTGDILPYPCNARICVGFYHG